jgi:hypothetical protein
MVDQIMINLWGVQAQATGLFGVCSLTVILLCWMMLRARRRSR